jgi:hypothetical protein
MEPRDAAARAFDVSGPHGVQLGAAKNALGRQAIAGGDQLRQKLRIRARI